MTVPKEMGRRRGVGIALFAAGVCILCVWWMARTFRRKEVWPILARADLAWVAAGGGGATLLYWVLRALRWYVLLARAGSRLPFRDVYLCTAVSLSLSLFTPGQSGEALKVEMLRGRGGIRRAPGYGTFVVERVLDLAVVALLAAMGVAAGLGRRHGAGVAVAALAGALGVAAAGVLAARTPALGGRWRGLGEGIRGAVGDSRALPGLLALTLVGWGAVGLLWLCLLRGVAIELGFPRVMAMMSVVTLANVASLVPGAVGVSEVTASGVLSEFGCGPAAAQAGALALRFAGLISAALGIVHFLAWMMVRGSKPAAPAGDGTGGAERDGAQGAAPGPSGHGSRGGRAAG